MKRISWTMTACSAAREAVFASLSTEQAGVRPGVARHSFVTAENGWVQPLHSKHFHRGGIVGALSKDLILFIEVKIIATKLAVAC